MPTKKRTRPRRTGGRKQMWDWADLLSPPPGKDVTLWTLSLAAGTDFDTKKRPGPTPVGMGSMVRKWAAKYGYTASVRVDGGTVVATLGRV